MHTYNNCYCLQQSLLPAVDVFGRGEYIPNTYTCCVYVCVRACVRACVCIYIYIYIYMHTCIHAYNNR